MEEVADRKVPSSASGHRSPAGLEAVGQVEVVLPVDEGAGGENTAQSGGQNGEDQVHCSSPGGGEDPCGGADIDPAEEGDREGDQMGEELDGECEENASGAKGLAHAADHARYQQDGRDMGDTEQAVRADHKVDRCRSRHHLHQLDKAVNTCYH